MKKNSVIFLLLILTAMAWGCRDSEGITEEPETSLTVTREIDTGQLLTYGDILGKSDEETVAILGEGEPAYLENNGTKVITARLYQKNVLGFNGETVLDYTGEEEPMVEEVLITFSGATFGDVVDVISQQIGEAAKVERTEEKNAAALWQYDNIFFDLTYYGGVLLLTIKKDI
ncbi:MAG: hypothetical protein Q4C00_02705 [Bacillota bacterium]|nr:hypothetical protein [Bacillota bacterium]